MGVIQEQDKRKIEAIIGDYVTHWNKHDMEAWGALFTQDIDYINRNGGWWKNRKDNIAGHEQVHAWLRESGQPTSFSLEIQKLDFLKPDIAIVQAKSVWPGFRSEKAGRLIENIMGMLTCVFVKIEGKWLIKTLHNTLIDDPIHHDEPVDVVRQIKEALIEADESGNWSRFLNLMADDVTFTATIAAGAPISGVFKGKARVAAYFGHILPSVATFSQNKPIEIVIGKRKIIVLGDDTYTVVKNGKSARRPYAMVIHHKDGKISRILIIQDLSGIHDAYATDN